MNILSFISSISLIVAIPLTIIGLAILNTEKRGNLIVFTGIILLIFAFTLNLIMLLYNIYTISKHSTLLTLKKNEIINKCASPNFYILEYKLYNFPNCFLPVDAKKIKEECFDDIRGYVEGVDIRRNIKEKICFIYKNQSCIKYKC